MGRSAKTYKKPTRAQRATSSASKASRAPLPGTKPTKSQATLADKTKNPSSNVSPATKSEPVPRIAPHKAAYAAALAQGIRTPRDAGVDYLAQWEGKSGKRKGR